MQCQEKHRIQLLKDLLHLFRQFKYIEKYLIRQYQRLCSQLLIVESADAVSLA